MFRAAPALVVVLLLAVGAQAHDLSARSPQMALSKAQSASSANLTVVTVQAGLDWSEISYPAKCDVPSGPIEAGQVLFCPGNGWLQLTYCPTRSILYVSSGSGPDDMGPLTACPTDAKPPTVSGVAASVLSCTEASVSWLAADDQQVAGSQVTARSADGPAAVNGTHYGPGAHDTTLAGLQPGTTYRFGVDAVDLAGNHAAANATPFSFTTPPCASTTSSTGTVVPAAFDVWHPLAPVWPDSLFPGPGFSATAAASGALLAGLALSVRQAAKSRKEDEDGEDEKEDDGEGPCHLLHAIKDDATPEESVEEAWSDGKWAAGAAAKGAPVRRLRRGPGWSLVEIDGAADGADLEHGLEGAGFRRELVAVWPGGCTHGFEAEGGYLLAGGLVVEGLRGRLEVEVEAEAAAEAETDGEGAITNALSRHLKAGPAVRTFSSGSGGRVAVGLADLLGQPAADAPDDLPAGAQAALEQLAALGIPAGALHARDNGHGRFQASAALTLAVPRLRVRVRLAGEARRVRLAALVAQPTGTLEDGDCPAVIRHEPWMDKVAAAAGSELGSIARAEMGKQMQRLRAQVVAAASAKGRTVAGGLLAFAGKHSNRRLLGAGLAVLSLAGAGLALSSGLLVDKMPDGTLSRVASGFVGGLTAWGVARAGWLLRHGAGAAAKTTA